MSIYGLDSFSININDRVQVIQEMAVSNSNLIGLVPREVVLNIHQNDEEIMALAVSQKSQDMRFASARLKNSIEFANKVLIENDCVDAIAYFGDDIKDNKKIALKVCERFGLKLKNFSDKLKCDKDVVLKAVNQNGLALEYADNKFKNDAEVCLRAYNSTCKLFGNVMAGGVIECMGEQIKQQIGDKNIIDTLSLIISKQNNYNYLSKKLLEKHGDNKDFVLDNLRKDGLLLEFVSDRLKNDKDVVIEALNQNFNACDFVGEKFVGCIKHNFGDTLKNILKIDNDVKAELKTEVVKTKRFKI